jgi:hypothetical protein
VRSGGIVGNGRADFGRRHVRIAIANAPRAIPVVMPNAIHASVLTGIERSGVERHRPPRPPPGPWRSGPNVAAWSLPAWSGACLGVPPPRPHERTARAAERILVVMTEGLHHLRGYERELIRRDADLGFRFVRRPRLCWFCSRREGKATREHVFPMWLLNRLRAEDDFFTPTHLDRYGRPISTRVPIPASNSWPDACAPSATAVG